MIPRKVFFPSIALFALATSCTSDLGPEISDGLVKVTVTTSGGDLDDRYVVVIGPDRRELSANGSFTVTANPGQTTVELTEVAGNCRVEGSSSVTIDVSRANTTDVPFKVNCWPTGFQVTVGTTGDDTPRAFTLQLTGESPRIVPVNASLLISRLQPGAYELRLESPLANCSTTGPAELSVDLPPLTIVPVRFEVACAPVARLEKIAYQVDSMVGPQLTSFLAVAKPDGTEQWIIGMGSAPSWSPSGKKYAYSGIECTSDYFYYYDFCDDIVRAYDPETFNSLYIGQGGMPAWSPNDDAIALVKSNGSLALVALNTLVSVPLNIPDSIDSADPAWSPDGRTIAFACNSPHGFSRLCIINKDGSGFRQLTDDTSEPARHPAWSHDGTTIVFTSIGVRENAIATIAPAGGAVTKLTEGFDPAWSRDGTQLIFARSDGLFKMNRDGSDVQRLTTGRHRAPAWRP